MILSIPQSLHKYIKNICWHFNNNARISLVANNLNILSKSQDSNNDNNINNFKVLNGYKGIGYLQVPNTQTRLYNKIRVSEGVIWNPTRTRLEY